RYVWRELLRLRREQLAAAAKIEQPALFELKEDSRLISERTAAGAPCPAQPARVCREGRISYRASLAGECIYLLESEPEQADVPVDRQPCSTHSVARSGLALDYATSSTRGAAFDDLAGDQHGVDIARVENVSWSNRLRGQFPTHPSREFLRRSR